MLGLIVNTIVLYNTIYIQRALDHIAATTGSETPDEDIERLSPLGSDHTTLTGRDRVLLPVLTDTLDGDDGVIVDGDLGDERPNDQRVMGSVQ